MPNCCREFSLRCNHRVLKLDRRVVNPTSLADICQEDPVVYTPIDMIEMLDMIHEGNRTVGGLSMTAKGYGIVGFVRFLDCYYLNFITQRRLVRAKTAGACCMLKGRCREMRNRPWSLRLRTVPVIRSNPSPLRSLDTGRCDWRQPCLRHQSDRNVCHQARRCCIRNTEVYRSTRQRLQRIRQHVGEGQSAA